jgi:hypothetical protein
MRFLNRHSDTHSALKATLAGDVVNYQGIGRKLFLFSCLIGIRPEHGYISTDPEERNFISVALWLQFA